MWQSGHIGGYEKENRWILPSDRTRLGRLWRTRRSPRGREVSTPGWRYILNILNQCFYRRGRCFSTAKQTKPTISRASHNKLLFVTLVESKGRADTPPPTCGYTIWSKSTETTLLGKTGMDKKEKYTFSVSSHGGKGDQTPRFLCKAPSPIMWPRPRDPTSSNDLHGSTSRRHHPRG